MTIRSRPNKPPVDEELIEIVRNIPAEFIATVPRKSSISDYYSATVFHGEPRYVHYPAPCCGGKTPEEACEDVKAWLLQDIQALGTRGKRHFQPHYDDFDLRWRLIKAWNARREEAQAARDVAA